MSVKVQVSNIEEVPEIMRNFVSEVNGEFVYDETKALDAIAKEREISKGYKNDLRAFKALNVNADELGQFIALGKTPEEIAAMIAAANDDEDSTKAKLTETEKLNLELSKNMKALQKKLDAMEAESVANKAAAEAAALRKAVEDAISQLPNEIDRDKIRLYLMGGKHDGIDVPGIYSSLFKRDALGDLEEIGGLTAVEYITKLSKSQGFVKSSNPGNVKTGNATIYAGNVNAAYLAAKESKNIFGMVQNAPREQKA